MDSWESHMQSGFRAKGSSLHSRFHSNLFLSYCTVFEIKVSRCVKIVCIRLLFLCFWNCISCCFTDPEWTKEIKSVCVFWWAVSQYWWRPGGRLECTDYKLKALCSSLVSSLCALVLHCQAILVTLSAYFICLPGSLPSHLWLYMHMTSWHYTRKKNAVISTTYRQLYDWLLIFGTFDVSFSQKYVNDIKLKLMQTWICSARIYH